jgi:hypothetical protein
MTRAQSLGRRSQHVGRQAVRARLRVELDAVPKNRVPDWIEGHEHAPDELAIVEEDTHSHESGRRGKAHGDRCRRVEVLLGPGRGQPAQGDADWAAGRGTARAAGCSALGVLGTGQQGRCAARNSRGAGPPGGCSWTAQGRRARQPVGAAAPELEEQNKAAVLNGAAEALLAGTNWAAGGARRRRCGATVAAGRRGLRARRWVEQRYSGTTNWNRRSGRRLQVAAASGGEARRCRLEACLVGWLGRHTAPHSGCRGCGAQIGRRRCGGLRRRRLLSKQALETKGRRPAGAARGWSVARWGRGSRAVGSRRLQARVEKARRRRCLGERREEWKGAGQAASRGPAAGGRPTAGGRRLGGRRVWRLQGWKEPPAAAATVEKKTKPRLIPCWNVNHNPNRGWVMY